jgi:adenylate kinase
MLIWVGGVPGVGKTTTLSRTFGLNGWGDRVVPVKGSDILMKLAGKTVISQLDKLDSGLRRELTGKMHEFLLNEDVRDPNRIRVDDGHFTIPNSEGGYRCVLPTDRYTAERTSALVLIDTSAELIYEHLCKPDCSDRFQDRLGRYFKYGQENVLDAIEEYRVAEFKAARNLESTLAKKLYVIDNSSDIEITVRGIHLVIEQQIRTVDERINEAKLSGKERR